MFYFKCRLSKRAIVMFSVIMWVMSFNLPVFSVESYTDMDIQDAVEDQIIQDAYVYLVNIDVAVNDGIVKLTGKVDNLLMKDRIEKIAEMVKGVRAVVNQLVVQPFVVRTDSEIKDDVKNALLLDPATEAYDLTVDVKDGVVTLGGHVQSWQERALSGKVVKNVIGVRKIINNVTVYYKTKRPDTEIKEDVESAMHWNILLDDALIEVKVKDAKVTLSGLVGSAAEKSEAFNTAMVMGVTSVDTTGLKVDKWTRNKDFRQSKHAEKTDSDIGKAVKGALFNDARVFSFDIDVSVENGNVTLRGNVDNLKAKRAVAQDARNTVGVNAVKNRVKVRPDNVYQDAVIAKNVRKALRQNPVIQPYEVDVNVRNGIVYLFGQVHSSFEKAEADELAALIKGVLAVDNNLTVERPYRRYVYDPYLDDWYLYDYEWFRFTPPVPTKSDDAIQHDIRTEFFWSPYVNSDDVTVTVDNGIATLSGKVDSWTEYYSAQKNAYDGGAVHVRNNLTVK